jgi:hypothetical protein
MVYLQTKKTVWVNFGGPCNGKGLVYFKAIWNILLPFGIYYGNLETIWYSFPRFGTLCQEKSGNPG